MSITIQTLILIKDSGTLFKNKKKAICKRQLLSMPRQLSVSF